MNDWTYVFDLDGTLVDSAPDLAAATNHVMASLGLPMVDAAEIRPFVGHGALVMIERTAAHHGRHFETAELHALFETFIAHYTANIAVGSRPYDGITEVLDQARRSGARLAVCTNKLEAHAIRLLQALDLHDSFDAITGRDTFDFYKPDPRHLIETIARCGGDRTRTIMVGDTETDIRCAQAAGVPVVALDFGYSVEPVASFAPDVVISHYRDWPVALATVLQISTRRYHAPSV